MRTTRHTSREAKMWLRKGMQMISAHDTDSDVAIFDKKIEIYPRFLLKYIAVLTTIAGRAGRLRFSKCASGRMRSHLKATSILLIFN